MKNLLKNTLLKQYNKTLDILIHVIGKYDETLWLNDSDYRHPAWQLVYHALYYANIYCAPNEKAKVKWPRQIKDYHLFMKTKKQEFASPYSRDDMLAFLEFFRGKIPGYLEHLEPEADCWPHWYDENQLEFHINNIRHIQHHTAEVIERADIISKFDYPWI